MFRKIFEIGAFYFHRKIIPQKNKILKKTLCWHRPTFPGLSPSIIGAEGLNCCVRNGNRCTPFATDTNTKSFIIMIKFWNIFLVYCPPKDESVWEKEKNSFVWLVLLGWTHYWAYTCSLSTWWSLRRLIPIKGGKSYLEWGFTLRCFQRLSRPFIATRPCRWHDNRYTRGTSTPVLSY